MIDLLEWFYFEALMYPYLWWVGTWVGYRFVAARIPA